MLLKDFVKKYGNFTVPAFMVKVAGDDLIQDLSLNVASVEVDLKEKTAGRFSFKVVDAFDWKTRTFVSGDPDKKIQLLDTFAFGTAVEIRLGYGDPKRLPPLLKGVITEVGTAFNQGEMPELNVSGYDNLYPLTTGRNQKYWEQVTDSQAVTEILGKTKLSASIRPTDTVKDRIEQSQESDIAFIQKLAERNGATFYARNDDFYFGPRNNDKAEVVTLPWGEGLLNFSPEANLAQQVETVEVHSWSAEKGEPIIGRASRNEQSGRDAGRKSGAERIAEALNNKPVMKVRAAVHTQAEADSRARAILEEKSQAFMKAEGESIGLPEILPDTNIAFTDLGPVFSKTYYISGTVHRIDGSGYSTSISMQETNL